LDAPVFELNNQNIIDDNAWLAAQGDGEIPFWIPPLDGISALWHLGVLSAPGSACSCASQPRLNLWGEVEGQSRIIMYTHSLSPDDVNNGVNAGVAVENSLFQVNQLIQIYYEVSGPRMNLSRSQSMTVQVHRSTGEPQYPGQTDPYLLADATPRAYLKQDYDARHMLSVAAYVPRGAMPQPGDIITVYLDLAGYTDRNRYTPQPRLQLIPYPLTDTDIHRSVQGLESWVMVNFGDTSGPNCGFSPAQLANVDGCNGEIYFCYQQANLPPRISRPCPVLIDVSTDTPPDPDDLDALPMARR
jgi:hypothetical protein